MYFPRRYTLKVKFYNYPELFVIRVTNPGYKPEDSIKPASE